MREITFISHGLKEMFEIKPGEPHALLKAKNSKSRLDTTRAFEK